MLRRTFANSASVRRISASRPLTSRLRRSRSRSSCWRWFCRGWSSCRREPTRCWAAANWPATTRLLAIARLRLCRACWRPCSARLRSWRLRSNSTRFWANSRRLACRSCWLRARATRPSRTLSWIWSNWNSPTRNRSLTSSISPSERALIRLPVRAVITTAVLRGRRLNRLRRALPTIEPRRSPRVDRTPPSTSRARINNQADKGVSGSPPVSLAAS